MSYKLKGGEELRDDKLYGWTGEKCTQCGGTGAGLSGNYPRVCPGCAGTGEVWGFIRRLTRAEMGDRR